MTNDKEGGIIQKNNRGGAVYGRKQKNEQKFWEGVNPSKKRQKRQRNRQQEKTLMI